MFLSCIFLRISGLNRIFSMWLRNLIFRCCLSSHLLLSRSPWYLHSHPLQDVIVSAVRPHNASSIFFIVITSFVLVYVRVCDYTLLTVVYLILSLHIFREHHLSICEALLVEDSIVCRLYGQSTIL